MASESSGHSRPGGGFSGVAAPPYAARIATVRLPSAVHSLAFDPFRDALWYVPMSLNGPTALYEASATTGAVLDRFPLPAPASDGLDGQIGALESFVAVAPDKSIWYGSDYALIGVDPATGAIRTRTLPLAVAGAPSSESEGSWISALTFTATSAIVGRANVPFLQQFSLDMKPLAEIPLPAGASGPVALTVAGTSLDVATRTHQSRIEQLPIPLPAGLSAPLTPAGTAIDPATLLVPGNTQVELITTSGRTVLVPDVSARTLTWHPTADVTLPLPWPVHSGEVANPLGQMVSVVFQPDLMAAAQTPNGTLWLVQSIGSTTSLAGYAAIG